MGNKTPILNILYALFPRQYNRYIEPFGGSGAVLLGKEQPDKFEVYNDYNRNLVNLFRCMRDRPMEFIRTLGFLNLNARDDFLVLRRFFDKEEFTDEFLQQELELTEIMLPPPEAREIRELYRASREDYDLRMVGFDPYLSRTITQRLEPIVSVMEVPQDLKNMSPAMKEMDDLMTRHQLLHVHNTCFRWTFGNVRCYVDGNGNIKPLKNKSTGRIDPTVAAIIAIAVWMIMRNQKPDLAEAMSRPGFSL